MNFDMKLEVGFEFVIEKFNKDGVIWKSDPIKNMVLNCGLLSLYNYTLLSMSTYINIGTGTSTPVATQTGLDNRLYSTNSLFVAYEVIKQVIINPCIGFKKVFQFSIGTCTGTFTELGLSRLSNSEYFNRQRFKDATGAEIAVQVAADEGLRITCIGKMIIDPSIKPYGKIVKVNLSGATSGGITFYNPNKSKSYTLTVAQMRGCLYNNLEVGSIDNYFVNTQLSVAGTAGAKYNPDDDCFYIAWGWSTTNLATPLVYDDLQISANTLVGNLEPPVITTVQPYNDTDHPAYTVDFFDETAATTVSKTYHKHVNLLYYTGSYYSFYPPFDTNSYLLLDLAISSWTLKPAAALLPSTLTVTSAPTLGNSSVTKKAYFAPGKLSTGTYVITYMAISHNHSAGSTSGQLAFNLAEPISVANTEEIEFTFTISWGNFSG